MYNNNTDLRTFITYSLTGLTGSPNTTISAGHMWMSLFLRLPFHTTTPPLSTSDPTWPTLATFFGTDVMGLGFGSWIRLDWLMIFWGARGLSRGSFSLGLTLIMGGSSIGVFCRTNRFLRGSFLISTLGCWDRQGCGLTGTPLLSIDCEGKDSGLPLVVFGTLSMKKIPTW